MSQTEAVGARSDRRVDRRLALSIPVRVRGCGPDGTPWEQMALTQNASAKGAGLLLPRLPRVGEVLHLSLPLPKVFRQYDLAEQAYRVYAVVRHATAQGGTAVVGVLLLGRQPPVKRKVGSTGAGEAHRPEERRRQPRLHVALNVRVAGIDLRSGEWQEHLGVVTNLGPGGAAVRTSLPCQAGQIVDVEEIAGAFWARAEVRQALVGDDNLSRLNLRFLGEASSVSDAFRALLASGRSAPAAAPESPRGL